MIRVLPEQKIVLLENEALRVALDYSCGLHFAEFSNRFGAGRSNVWRELFTLRAYGGEYASETFTCTNVSHAKDEALEMATFLLENRELCMKMRVHLMDEGKRELRLSLGMSHSTGTNSNPAGAINDNQTTVRMALVAKLNLLSWKSKK